MVYANNFHRLVMIGSLYSDTFNVTLAFAPTPGPTIPPVTSGLLTAVAGVVGAWWDEGIGVDPTSGLGIISAAKLTSVKLNRIGVDGKYVDPITQEHVYPTPISGSNPTLTHAQLSLVATLRGSDERGKAGKGRMYWPPSQAVTQAPDSGGRVNAGTADLHARGTRNLVQLLNGAYTAAGVDALAVIASRVGAGRFQVITKVSVGRVADTMRSRRNKQIEDPQEVSVTIPPEA